MDATKRYRRDLKEHRTRQRSEREPADSLIDNIDAGGPRPARMPSTFGSMILYTPNKVTATKLAEAPSTCEGFRVAEGALPPKFIWNTAIADRASEWVMPRLIVDEREGLVVGAVGFKTAPYERTGEIGYNVAPAFRGKGYASEGVRLICLEALSSGQVSEIKAETLVSNVASQRVLEKVGFTVCGGRNDGEGQLKIWHLSNLPHQSSEPTLASRPSLAGQERRIP